jgi:hypothetical protein
LDLDDLGFVRLETHADAVSAEGHEVCADDDYEAFEFTTDADGVAVHYERLAERIPRAVALD